MIKANLTDSNYYLPNKRAISSQKAKLYFSRRKYLKTVIKTIHKKVSVNTQAYFLTLFLMDNIFIKDNLEKIFYEHFPMRIPLSLSKDIQLNDYILLSFVCLMISYKFYGNNSILLSMSNIVKILHYISDGNFGFTPRDLIVGEACVIKILKYKLNFYTVYHYLVFFFTHGIIFKKTLKKSIIPEKKNLEKIYIKAREITDYIVDKEEYFELYNGKYNYILVCQILKWSIENVLNIRIKESEDIFRVIYNIKITEEQKKKFLEIIKSKKKVKNVDNNNHIDNLNNVNKMNEPLKRESSYNSTVKNFGKKYLNYYGTPGLNDSNIPNKHKHNQSINGKMEQNNSNLKRLNFRKTSTNILDKNNSFFSSIKGKEIEITSELNSSKIDIKDEIEKEPLDSQKTIRKKQEEIKGYLSKKNKITQTQISFYSGKINDIKKKFEKRIITNEEEFIFNIGENELKSGENIKKPKVFNNFININKNYSTKDYSFPPNNNNKIYYFKDMKQINNKNFQDSFMNKTLEIGPKDSIRKNNYRNKIQNKIIINNNMHINTFINNSNNFHNENVVSELLKLTNYNECYTMNPPIINITLNNH